MFNGVPFGLSVEEAAIARRGIMSYSEQLSPDAQKKINELEKELSALKELVDHLHRDIPYDSGDGDFYCSSCAVQTTRDSRALLNPVHGEDCLWEKLDSLSLP